MDWFEKLTGFQEKDYDDTRAKLRVEGKRLRSLINDKDYGCRSACNIDPLSRGIGVQNWL
jgi:hypothetical protein